MNDPVRYEKTLLTTYKHPQAGPFPPHDMWETFKPFSKSAKNMIFLRVGLSHKRGGALRTHCVWVSRGCQKCFWAKPGIESGQTKKNFNSSYPDG